ncbi:MAG: hypothetical protein D8H95_45735 [Lachnospiraceae bacterium]|nr:MAG: hypothetical protein D8H95_45735 [Lachnospiraceae bacterium]
MSDIKIFNISGGAVIMINPPIDYEEITDVRLINKISRKDKSSFLFPALYGNFHCVEGEFISDEVYEGYEKLKKSFAYENIFVFESLKKSPDIGENYLGYSINSLISCAENIISAQDVIKTKETSAIFETFLKTSFYLDFIAEYSFTVSEIVILNGLLKYAFLSNIVLETLINEIKADIENKSNKKLLRKEILNALRQRLS